MSWSPSGEPLLLVDTQPGQRITASCRVLLDQLEHRWELGPVVAGDDGRVDLPLQIPPEAWLDDLAHDYLTQLVFMVDFDGHYLRAPPAWPVWPQGRLAEPSVYDAEAQQRLAPNGVLRAELRAGAGPHEWIAPDLGSRSASRADEPQDSGGGW